MPKLQDCQFIKIEFDKKAIGGTSEEKDYKGWMEGYSPFGLSAFSSIDGVFFDVNQLTLIVTKDSGTLFEQFLKRGYKDITFTIVHRASDQFDQNYESQRTTHTNCEINSMQFGMLEEKTTLLLSFVTKGTVEVLFNVPNAAGDGLEKVGPIKYSIPEKTLK